MPTYSPERNYIVDQAREQAMLTQFLLAKDSAIIELPAGHVTLNQSQPLDGELICNH